MPSTTLGYISDITADGRYLLVGHDNGKIVVWDLVTAHIESVLAGHEDRVSALAVSSDGHLAISGSWDTTLRIWDIQQAACRWILSGHENWISALVVVPNSRNVISCSYDCKLCVWDMYNGQCLRKLTGHSDWITSANLIKNNFTALSAGLDRTLRLWDINTGKIMAIAAHPAEVSAMAVVNGAVVIGDTNGHVTCYDVKGIPTTNDTSDIRINSPQVESTSLQSSTSQTLMSVVMNRLACGFLLMMAKWVVYEKFHSVYALFRLRLGSRYKRRHFSNGDGVCRESPFTERFCILIVITIGGVLVTPLVLVAGLNTTDCIWLFLSGFTIFTPPAIAIFGALERNSVKRILVMTICAICSCSSLGILALTGGDIWIHKAQEGVLSIFCFLCAIAGFFLMSLAILIEITLLAGMYKTRHIICPVCKHIAFFWRKRIIICVECGDYMIDAA